MPVALLLNLRLGQREYFIGKIRIVLRHLHNLQRNSHHMVPSMFPSFFSDAIIPSHSLALYLCELVSYLLEQNNY